MLLFACPPTLEEKTGPRLWIDDLPIMGDIDSNELQNFISDFQTDDFSCIAHDDDIDDFFRRLTALPHSARKTHQTFFPEHIFYSHKPSDLENGKNKMVVTLAKADN
jgi:hypothetical protein